METIQANSRLELIDVLKSIDITVPQRTKGRTTEHTERYSIVQYLRTLVEQRLYRISVHGLKLF